MVRNVFCCPHNSPKCIKWLIKMKNIIRYSFVLFVSVLLVSILSIIFETVIYRFRLAGALSSHVRNSFRETYWANGVLLIIIMPLYLYLTHRYVLNFKKRIFLISIHVFLIVFAFAYGTFAGGFDFSSIYTYYRILVSLLLGCLFVYLERFFIFSKYF